ncbi:hypothetical protein Ddc_15579 [Ditylenchus destructor]|nr:hypothetical protein Ddc_15579 [Ditylenchus destructor]
MASNNQHQQIVADIEAQIFDIDRRLKALSPAEQKKLINEERDRLMSVARNVLANRGGTANRGQIMVNYGAFPSGISALGDTFAWIASKLLQFLGFDPFKWCYFEEYDHNPSFANRAFSNPSLFDALEQAERFDEKVASAADVDRVTNIILGFCKNLLSARNGYGLLISVNCVKQILMDTIKLLLQSEVSQAQFERQCSYPLVLESGELCWVKYKFVSNTYIQKYCVWDEKRVNMDVTIWYYWFPSESDFRQALRRIEHEDD